MSDLGQRIAALSPEQRQALMAKLRASAKPAPDPSRAPITRAGLRPNYPASFAQERLWFLHSLDPQGHSYSGSTALRLRGALNRDALVAALTAIVNRHEVLRSTFVEREGQLLQMPGDVANFAVPVISVLDGTIDARLNEVRERVAAIDREPYDLAAGPLFRVALFELADDEHVLVLSAHHIVADGASVEPLIRELSALYAAFLADRPSPLPELSIQYGDYAIWERNDAAANGLARDLDYWRNQLSGFEPLNLTLDVALADTPGEGGHERHVIPRVLTDRLKQLARETRTTLFMILLAGFDTLLFRCTGQTDLVVATPTANRVRPELEPLVGFFVNLLVLRTRLRGSLSVVDLIERVRTTTLDAFEHQHAPFEKLVEALCPERDGMRNPLAHVAFALQGASFAELELQGLAVSRIDLVEDVTRFDLEVHVSESGGGLELKATYARHLFEPETIGRLLRHYVRILEGVVADRNSRLDDLMVLSEHERASLLGPASSMPDPCPTIRELFERQLRARPHEVAVEDGGRRWTYLELSHEARHLAALLRSKGAGPNVAVGVWMERGGPLVSAIVGVALAEAAYVPGEVDQPVARATAMWTETRASVVVTTRALAATLPAGPWEVVTVDTIAAAPANEIPVLGAADDLAYVLYTSGSTGRPKGVAVPQRAVIRLVCDTDYIALGPDSVIGHAASVAFDAATFEIWGALLRGGRLVIVPTDVVISPASLAAYLQRTGVTTLFLTTALVHQIGREMPAALASVDTVLFGGEAVVPRWVAAIQEAGAPRRLVHVYGPTENTTFSTWFTVDKVRPDAETIPIGGAIANTQIYVLDAIGQLVPPGAPGELCLGGDGLSPGYVAAPRETAARFVPDGVSGAFGARLYRTGDVVRRVRRGGLVFIGRRDTQVKLRGHRIELGEIEACLCGHPDVAAAVVVIDGIGADQRLIAYVSPLAEVTLAVATLRDALKAQLPSYMVPAVIMVLDRLPLNQNGKVDRSRLPAPDSNAPLQGPSIAPRSRMEAQISAVWCEVLGLSAVGVSENFFDLGGHSLLLVRLKAGLERVLDRKVPLVTLFQRTTVEAQAAYFIEGSSDEGAVAVSPAVSANREPIAIIGMAGRFPGASDIEALWTRLRNGDELIRHFTRDELIAAGVPPSVVDRPGYVRARAVLDDVDQFDAALFGYTPREAALIDPQQRLLLETAWTALEHAGYAPTSEHALRIGVYAGCSQNTYAPQPVGHEAIAMPDAFEWMLASSKDFLATRVSYKLQLTGPAVTVQTACSTSLVAVHYACQALLAGECDMALAGGVSVTVPSVGGYQYFADGIVSPDGHCRPFDARAAGTIGGNGVGVVVLKRLSRALADGDLIHAVIRGSAINNDGAGKVGFTAPSVTGQAAVIAAAQALADVRPDSIGYVEAHGTGTALGDPIEVTALRDVFGNGAGRSTCALGSLKSNMGHLDAAAGVAGLIKTVLALEHGELPPSLHFEAPSPHVDLGPFYVPTRTQPWTSRDGVPRRAGVSSFGMGGTNAHVILEEAPPRPATHPRNGWHVIPVSGQTREAADAAVDALAHWLEAHPDSSIADVAHTHQIGRPSLAIRRVAVARDVATAVASLRSSQPTTVTSGRRPVVWLFPGQGAQFIGMGRELYEREPIYRAEIDACAAAIDGVIDGGLVPLLYPHAAGERTAAALLAQTRATQIALVAVELALAALWRSWGLTPDVVVGHSVGELAAACVAGVLSRDDAMQLAAARGQFMSTASGGGLLAIAAEEAAVLPELGNQLWLAAVNSPRQCVVAGTSEALEELANRLAGRGIWTQRLSAAGPFHSGMLAHVEEPLNRIAGKLTRNAPHTPWISSATGTVLSAFDATAAEYWGRQVTATVRWADAVAAARRHLAANPVWLEVGPGHTLIQLVRAGDHTDEVTVASFDTPDAAQGIATAAGQLWAAGVVMSWSAIDQQRPHQTIALPTYPFQRQRYWIEADSSSGRQIGTTLTKRPDIGDWFYTPGWIRTPLDGGGVADPAGNATAVLLLIDDTDDGEAIARSFQPSDVTVICAATGSRFERTDASRYVVNPDRREDFIALLDDLSNAGRLPNRILHAWQFDAAPSRRSRSLLHLVQALQLRITTAITLVVATIETQDVTGHESLQPEGAAVHGLSRVIAQELPHVRCRTVDIARSATGEERSRTARQLKDELLSANSATAIAYRGVHRWVEQFNPRPLKESHGRPALLRSGGVYLITGGFGRVGLALAESLAHVAGARLALVGRSAVPPSATWESWKREHGETDSTRRLIERLQDLQTLGADIATYKADVSNPDEMRAVIDSVVSRWGAVHGVIHAAGLTSGATFAPIEQLTSSSFDDQLQAKAVGARVLAGVLSGLPLDFCFLTSSISTVLGGLGFAAYASANAVLDAFAAQQTRVSGGPWMSAAWDGWVFDAASAEGPASKLAMQPEEGAKAFLRLMDADPVPRVVVSTADLDRRRGIWILNRADQHEIVPSQRPDVGESRRGRAPYVAPRSETECVLAAIWEELMGIERIGIHDDFFELGGHSLLGTQMLSRARERLNRPVALSDLFAAPTIEALSARIDAAAGAVIPERMRNAVKQVNAMSPEERQRVLAQLRREKGVAG